MKIKKKYKNNKKVCIRKGEEALGRVWMVLWSRALIARFSKITCKFNKNLKALKYCNFEVSTLFDWPTGAHNFFIKLRKSSKKIPQLKNRAQQQNI
jgi:hypothetical protein